MSTQTLFYRVCAALLLAFGLHTAARSQTVVAELHLDKKEPQPLWFEYVNADEGLVTVGYTQKYSTRYVGLFKYDATFKRQWVQDLYEQTDGRTLDQTVVLGDEVLVLLTDLNKKTGQRRTVYSLVDLKGQFIAREQELYTTTQDEKTETPFRFTRSINKRQVLSYKVNYTKGQNLSLQYFLFSADTATILNGKLPLPYTDDELLIREVKLTNSGQVLVLGKVLLPKKNAATSNTFVIFRYNPTTGQLREIPLNIPNLYITDLTLKANKYNDLYVTGFYSLKSTDQMIGSLYFRIDSQTDSIAVQHYEPFTADFLSRYLSPKQINKGQELNDFYLDDLVLRSDGGVLLLAERYYVTTESYRDLYGFFYTREFYHYDDVAVISLSPTGTIEWTAVVPKQQVGEYVPELSYLKLVGSDRIYFFYRDFQKGFGPNVYINTVDYEGTVATPKPFFKKFKESDTFYRSYSEQLSNTKGIIIYFNSNTKSLSLVKLEF